MADDDQHPPPAVADIRAAGAFDPRSLKGVRPAKKRPAKAAGTTKKLGRPVAALDRTQQRHIARLIGIRDKEAQIKKMAVACDRERDREILKAAKAGVAKAEIARALGMTAPRVFQIIKDQGATE